MYIFIKIFIMSNVISDFVGLFSKRQITTTPKDNDFVLLGQTGVGNINSSTQAKMRTRLVRVKDLGSDTLTTVSEVALNFVCDTSKGNYFELTLGDALVTNVVTLTNLGTGPKTIIVLVKQAPNVAGEIIGWKYVVGSGAPAPGDNAIWPGAPSVVPNMTPTVDTVDIYTFVWDGTLLRGTFTQNYN
jgi:hypothetical protein